MNNNNAIYTIPQPPQRIGYYLMGIFLYNAIQIALMTMDKFHFVIPNYLVGVYMTGFSLDMFYMSCLIHHGIRHMVNKNRRFVSVHDVRKWENGQFLYNNSVNFAISLTILIFRVITLVMTFDLFVQRHPIDKVVYFQAGVMAFILSVCMLSLPILLVRSIFELFSERRKRLVHAIRMEQVMRDCADVDCSICLDIENKAGIALECSHTFHRPCIEQWFSSNNNSKKCPICRAEVVC